MKDTKLITEELFSRQMTRKEFVQFAGMAIIALFGINNFLSFLIKNSSKSSQHNAKSGQGFGSSKFGV